MKFSELFASAANRAEVVCTFLALLELIRLKQLTCFQPEPFAEIEISRAVLAVPEASMITTPAATEAPGTAPASFKTEPDPPVETPAAPMAEPLPAAAADPAPVAPALELPAPATSAEAPSLPESSGAQTKA